VTFILAGFLYLQNRPTSSNRAYVALAAEPGAKRQSRGPKTIPNPFPHAVGNAGAGRTVFRFETFGNEGFWTNAMRLPQGMKAKKFTPIQALKAGLHVDIERIDPAMRRAMAHELKTDLSPRNAPMLNDPKTTVKLVNANAVIGVVARDTNGDKKMDIEHGDQVGIACAVCHTITDKSVFSMPGKGTIGRRIDGPATHSLNMGALLAMAANSRAYYPNLQVELGGKTIGRAPKGLTEKSSEAEVDAYLMNPKFYPVGTFDDTSDGHGNSVQNVPVFRTDLAAPWGSAGEHGRLENIGNASYTANLDLTTLVTPQGRKFLKIKGGAAGVELANDYAQILKETGVKGFPFVKSRLTGEAGIPSSPTGRRVENRKLLDLNAYFNSLQAPPGARVSAVAAARGRQMFGSNCTSCHNMDQSRRVPPILVPMKTIFPGYNPQIIARRQAPHSPIQNSPGTFDDKMIVIDASDRGSIRGNAMPLLLDLARKPHFLHDASVPSLDELLNPRRGSKAPHPFYIHNTSQRKDMVAFLRGLEIKTKGKAQFGN
jgi:cytochrome c2